MITLASLVVLAPLAADISGTVLVNGKPAVNAVVYVEGYGRPRPMTSEIVQKGKQFVPSVLVVPVGSTVSFPNMDAIYHNVFAEYQAKKFDLGMYPKGQTRTVTFDKPGLVSVLCNVHSNMSAFIMVVNSTAYAVTDRQGKFVIRNVDGAGQTIRAWHPSGAKLSEPWKPGTLTLQLKN